MAAAVRLQMLLFNLRRQELEVLRSGYEPFYLSQAQVAAVINDLADTRQEIRSIGSLFLRFN